MSFVTCKINSIIFKSNDGFIIMKIKIENTNDQYFKGDFKNKVISALGYSSDASVGQICKLEGNIIEDKKFGVQFKFRKIEFSKIQSNESIINYLSGSKFEGIGLKTATRIVEKLETDIVEKIIENFNCIVDIVGKRKAIIIQRILSNSKIIIKLQNYGFDLKSSMILYNKYKDEVLSIIEQDIFKLYYENREIKFDEIEKVCNELKIDLNSDIRMCGVIYYCVDFGCNREGGTYLSLEQLRRYIYKMSSNSDNIINNLDKCLNILKNNKYIFIVSENIVLNYNYLEEIEISNKIKNMLSNKCKLNIKNVNFNDDGIDYTSEQQSSILNSFKHNVSIITGGPGTGKTTIIKKIVDTFIKNNYKSYDIALLAPTGKASKRIEQSVKRETSTIHKFLGYGKDLKFQKSINNKVTQKLVIIDECSMISNSLFYKLIQSLENDTRLILVGDYNQLPSISSGEVLLDLINSKQIPVTILNKIHRQSEKSSIIKLAHDINHDNNIEIDGYENDISFFNINDSIFEEKLIYIIKIAIKKGYTVEDLQVLIPIYNSDVGINYVNNILQNLFNPTNKIKKEVKYYSKLFREGDKVIQLINRSIDNIMNGDTGYIKKIEKIKNQYKIIVEYDSCDVLYNQAELSQINHAYAISVHKSQGSEYKTVILPIFNQYHMLLSNKLIYTAITRAKKSLILIGDLNLFKKSVKKRVLKRQTLLSNRLQNSDLNNLINNKLTIFDDDIPFDELGEENMEKITPYNFM